MSQILSFQRSASSRVDPGYLGHTQTGETQGAVARVVGIEGGVVSEVINLESSGVRAPDRRPRHDQHYHEDRFLAA